MLKRMNELFKNKILKLRIMRGECYNVFGLMNCCLETDTSTNSKHIFSCSQITYSISLTKIIDPQRQFNVNLHWVRLMEQLFL